MCRRIVHRGMLHAMSTTNERWQLLTVLPRASPLAHDDAGGQTCVPPRCDPARRRRSERVVARPTFESAHRRAYQWLTRREGSAARSGSEETTPAVRMDDRPSQAHRSPLFGERVGACRDLRVKLRATQSRVALRSSSTIRLTLPVTRPWTRRCCSLWPAHASVLCGFGGD